MARQLNRKQYQAYLNKLAAEVDPASPMGQALKVAAYPATPDTTIKVGDRVRSYDFAGNVTCYVEGVVELIDRNGDRSGCPCYAIACDKRVVDGITQDKVPGYVFPPLNGVAMAFGGVCRGVVRI